MALELAFRFYAETAAALVVLWAFSHTQAGWTLHLTQIYVSLCVSRIQLCLKIWVSELVFLASTHNPAGMLLVLKVPGMYSSSGFSQQTALSLCPETPQSVTLERTLEMTGLNNQ